MDGGFFFVFVFKEILDCLAWNDMLFSQFGCALQIKIFLLTWNIYLVQYLIWKVCCSPTSTSYTSKRCLKICILFLCLQILLSGIYNANLCLFGMLLLVLGRVTALKSEVFYLFAHPTVTSSDNASFSHSDLLMYLFLPSPGWESSYFFALPFLVSVLGITKRHQFCQVGDNFLWYRRQFIGNTNLLHTSH